MTASTVYAQAEWVANQNSFIIDSTSVHLEGDGDVTNTSVETPDLNMFVQAGATITFEYELFDGAECTGGAPRAFIEVDGSYDNSWDQNIGDGTQCGSNGVVSFTATEMGLIGHAGVVYDNLTGPGHVIVSNLTIGGELVLFMEEPSPTPGQQFGEILLSLFTEPGATLDSWSSGFTNLLVNLFRGR